jgi:F-type H+-transporting ATPase subunit delta
VENSGAIQASLSGRYASALFDLARDSKVIDKVESSLGDFENQLDENVMLLKLATDRTIPRGLASKAIVAVVDRMELDQLSSKFLGMLALNGRLSKVREIIASFRDLAANHRGEASATVTTAHPLDDKQVAALKAKLKTRVGRDVAVTLKTDPAILGGLIVKIGSQMIDGSIRTKLNTLAHAMKG